MEPQDNEIMAGALWSDPVLKPGFSPSSRGIGVFFGPDVTKAFLGKSPPISLNDLEIRPKKTRDPKKICNFFCNPCSERNNLVCIVRSHAEIRAGCGLSHVGCYTVFSAPNKDKEVLGGVVVVDGSKDEVEIQGNVFTDCSKVEALALLLEEEQQQLQPHLDQGQMALTSRGDAAAGMDTLVDPLAQRTFFQMSD